MRITYLHQYFTTPEMAGGTRSYEMARRLVVAGHEVDVVTSDREGSFPGARGWQETEEAGVRVHWLPVPYSNTMSYPARIRAFGEFALRSARFSTRLAPDVVFATSTPLTIALPGVHAARRASCPFVFEVRDLWPEVPIALGALRDPVSRYLAWRLQRYAYGNADHIVALAPGMKDAVAARGFPEDRVTVIPNGCDMDIFAIGPEPGRTLRERTPWLGDRRLVVYIGTLGLVNHVEYLVEVAARTAAIDPEVRFAIIGTGRSEASVRALATERGVLDRSLFMLPPVAKRDVAAWLSAADMATVLATAPDILVRNSVGNKFFDAIASGTPVAHNFEGWSATLASEAGAGVTLPAHDHSAAAGLLADALHDARWLARAGESASALASERFERGALAARLEQVLIEVTRR